MNIGNQSRSQKMHRMLKLGAFCGCFFNYLSAYKLSLFSWFDVQNYRTCNILFLEQLLAPRVSGGIFVTVQLVEFKNRLEKTTKIPSAHCVQKTQDGLLRPPSVIPLTSKFYQQHMNDVSFFFSTQNYTESVRVSDKKKVDKVTKVLTRATKCIEPLQTYLVVFYCITCVS